MSWINIDIDIHLDDIYNQMSDSDKKVMLEWIKDDFANDLTMSDSLMSEEWMIVCRKLSGLYYQMNEEDMETIKKIINKF
jgi:hypothetical protein